jgi:hypothetical protein
MVQAKCDTLTTGGYGLSMANADVNVDKLCDDGLAGYFTEGQTKYGCSQLSRNKIEFWTGWKGQGALSLDSEDCKMRLKNEINGCSLGGESVVADWFFR